MKKNNNQKIKKAYWAIGGMFELKKNMYYYY